MYRLKLHKTLTLKKWRTYNSDRQILMIANEVNRLLNGIKSSLMMAELRECMERVLELCDLTINCQRPLFQLELLRWRELFAENYLLDKRQLKHRQKRIRLLYRILLFFNPLSAELAEEQRGL